MYTVALSLLRFPNEAGHSAGRMKEKERGEWRGRGERLWRRCRSTGLTRSGPVLIWFLFYWKCFTILYCHPGKNSLWCWKEPFAWRWKQLMIEPQQCSPEDCIHQPPPSPDSEEFLWFWYFHEKLSWVSLKIILAMFSFSFELSLG